LDRLSFTVKVPFGEERFFLRLMQNSVQVGERYTARIPGFRYSWQVADGIHLDYGDKASGSGGGAVLRVDYNPQKYDLHDVIGLARFLGNPWNITRVDVAIDYPADLAGVIISHDTLLKSSRITGADGRLETMYLGSRQSGRFIRVYDKAREQKIDGTWWRVEAEHRCGGQDPLPVDLFDGLRVGLLPAGLTWNQRQILRSLQADPAALRSAPKRTRARYRAHLREIESLDPDPVQIYRAAHSGLLLYLFTLQVQARGGEVVESGIPSLVESVAG